MENPTIKLRLTQIELDKDLVHLIRYELAEDATEKYMEKYKAGIKLPS